MLTDNEAGTAYDEVLQKLRGVGAHTLAGEIELTVDRGRVQERERHPTQERLPATAASEIALRMLATWVKPVFLVSEAKALLREASAAEVGEVRWAHDRLDIVEPARSPWVPCPGLLLRSMLSQRVGLRGPPGRRVSRHLRSVPRDRRVALRPIGCGCRATDPWVAAEPVRRRLRSAEPTPYESKLTEYALPDLQSPRLNLL
jgi:hypothetical protein